MFVEDAIDPNQFARVKILRPVCIDNATRHEVSYEIFSKNTTKYERKLAVEYERHIKIANARYAS